jgi:hypothetical protein
MRWVKCREIGCCNYSLLPQSFENDDMPSLKNGTTMPLDLLRVGYDREHDFKRYSAQVLYPKTVDLDSPWMGFNCLYFFITTTLTDVQEFIGKYTDS